MNPENFQSAPEAVLKTKVEQQDGWHQEKQLLSDPLNRFIAGYFHQEDSRQHYLDGKGIHFSGTNTNAMHAYHDGIAHFRRIEMLRQGGKVTQIHGEVRGDSPDSEGQIVDVYITEATLERFVNENPELFEA